MAGRECLDVTFRKVEFRKGSLFPHVLKKIESQDCPLPLIGIPKARLKKIFIKQEPFILGPLYARMRISGLSPRKGLIGHRKLMKEDFILIMFKLTGGKKIGKEGK